MHLELLERAPSGSTKLAPLLFVHGVCHGAWCWEYWMEWFIQRGRPVYALSLRGHGNSGGRDDLHSFGLNDYRDDVIEVAREIGQRHAAARPILVGHSMGGAIAQMAAAAEHSLFSGVVLLASLPHNSTRFYESIGLLFDIRGMSALKRLTAGEQLTTKEIRNLIFFDRRISEDQADYFGPMLQPESNKAKKDLISFRAPKATLSLPTLVLGSARDKLFGRSALGRTAKYFNADLVILEEGCHDVMLDPTWGEYAEQLYKWLYSQRL